MNAIKVNDYLRIKLTKFDYKDLYMITIRNPNGIIVLGYKYLNNNVLIRVALK